MFQIATQHISPKIVQIIIAFLSQFKICSTFVLNLQCRDYKMSQLIEHTGVVDRIDGKYVRVQILQQAACTECHAKSACTASDSKVKYIDVETIPSQFQIGDTVILYGQSSMGHLAVLLAFVIPFLLILLTLIILNAFVVNESLSGTLALAMLVPYFLLLSFLKPKLKKKLKFHIRKTTD